MSQTIYLVSQGEYSDYGIVAVFSTREKAEAFVSESEAKALASSNGDGAWKLSYGEDMGIEEYELDAAVAPQKGAFSVSLSINSPYASLRSSQTVYARWDENASPTSAATAERDRYHPAHIKVVGFGETREHARRSASELQRAILAGTVIVP